MRSARFRIPVFVVLLVLTVSTAAFGLNSHTVAEWYHGLGDGANTNFYVHPFNDSTSNHAHTGNEVNLFNTNSGARFDNVCFCEHSHLFWDTAPTDERKFASYHSADARASNHSGNAALNFNLHCHHNYNGPWPGCP